MRLMERKDCSELRVRKMEAMKGKVGEEKVVVSILGHLYPAPSPSHT